MSNTYVNMKRNFHGSSGKTEKITTSATHAETTIVTGSTGGGSVVEVYTDATNGVYVSTGIAPNAATDTGRQYVPPKWLTAVEVGQGCKVSAVEA